jgi:hypothetical protein
MTGREKRARREVENGTMRAVQVKVLRAELDAHMSTKIKISERGKGKGGQAEAVRG